MTPLARACHPEAVAGVTAVSGALALSVGRGAGGAAAVVAAVFCGQLFVGWQNDYLDRAADEEAGRTDKPVAAGSLRPRTVRNAAAAALVLAVLLSLLSGGAGALAHYTALAMASLYNQGLKRTPASVVPFAVAFGLLPAFVTLGPPVSHAPAPWLTAAGALLGSGGHFVQVLPDIEGDRRQGSRGLPQLLGVRVATVVAAVLLSGAVLAVTLGPGGRPSGIALGACAAALGVVAVAVICALTRRERLAFRVMLLMLPAVVAGYAFR